MQAKRETVQAPPLGALQIRILQDMLMNKEGNAQERVIIGFVLFCLECRLRVVDGQRLREEPVLDVDSSGLGYIEAKAGVVKTSQAKRMKGKVLQIAGHSQDLAGRGWAAEWLALRRAEGMDVVRDGCLQPHPIVGGGWGRALMKSSELGVFLRSLLVDTVSERQGRITAHTLKATYLSWCAKYGVGKGTRKNARIPFEQEGREHAGLLARRDGGSATAAR